MTQMFQLLFEGMDPLIGSAALILLLGCGSLAVFCWRAR